MNALAAAPTEEQIRHLERHVLALPQVDLGTEHAVHGGLYVRQILIPAGTVATGAIHKVPHVSLMVYGDITVSTPAGMERITGPRLWLAGPGKKRVGFAHSDTLWLTVHRCESTTPEAAESELFDDVDQLTNHRLLT